MKRKVLSGLLIAFLAFSLVGCAESEEATTTTDEIIDETVDETTDEITNMANPWVDSDENGVSDATGFDLKVPAGATDVNYSYCTDDNMAQVTYSFENVDWVYRAKASSDIEDISGMYYEWVLVDDGMVAGNPAKYMGYSDMAEDSEYIDDVNFIQVVNWYVSAEGATYSLSASGSALNGMDIQVYAEQIFAAGDNEELAEEVTEEEGPCPYEGNSQLIFSTEDIDGHAISTEDLAEANLVMVNFWEPWCGPCVGEMPDLEKLYEEYRSQGFVILGVFQTEGMDADVRDVMDYCGTTYPILRYTNSMEPYTTEYVPTTIFMDQHGHVLTDEPMVGSDSYSSWKQVIEGYLNR